MNTLLFCTFTSTQGLKGNQIINLIAIFLPWALSTTSLNELRVCGGGGVSGSSCPLQRLIVKLFRETPI